MWSDSIDFYRAEDHIILWRDIQIDDTEHKVLAFGDYGEYWKEPGNAFLTRRPVDRELRPPRRAIRFSCAPIRCSCLRSTKTPNAGPRRLPPPIRWPFGRLAGAVGARFAGACCRRSRRSGRFAGASPFRRRPQGVDAADSLGTRFPHPTDDGRRRGFTACRAVASRRARIDLLPPILWAAPGAADSLANARIR